MRGDRILKSATLVSGVGVGCGCVRRGRGDGAGRPRAGGIGNGMPAQYGYLIGNARYVCVLRFQLTRERTGMSKCLISLIYIIHFTAEPLVSCLTRQ